MKKKYGLNMGGCLDNLFQSQATFTQLFCDGHNSYAAPTWDRCGEEAQWHCVERKHNQCPALFP